MGKGDKKTKRGKIFTGSFGVRRSHDKVTPTQSIPKQKVAAKAVAEKPAKATAAKPARKKATTAKTTAKATAKKK